MSTTKRVAFIFPGQGSQTVGMGKEFVENSQTAKRMLDEASAKSGIDFSKLMFEESGDLEQTEYTQPAILLVSLMAHALFKELVDVTPVVTLGHSLGEFSALASVGALKTNDAISLVHERGKLMKSACANINAGMMAVIGLGDDVVERVCSDAQADGRKAWPANYNSEGQIVIAGIKDDLRFIEPTLKEERAKRALLLNMSVASHCPLLEPAQAPLKSKMEQLFIDSFSAPIISNVTAKPYSSKAEAVDLLTKQLVEPVQYKQSILSLADEVDLFIEFGNGSVLKGLNRRIIKNIPTLSINNMKTLKEAAEAL